MRARAAVLDVTLSEADCADCLLSRYYLRQGSLRQSNLARKNTRAHVELASFNPLPSHFGRFRRRRTEASEPREEGEGANREFKFQRTFAGRR